MRSEERTDRQMGKTLVVTSGKGGVGKTTVTVNVGAALAKEGMNVLLIDADLGLRNLDLMMGLENRIVYDIVDVLEAAAGGGAQQAGGAAGHASRIADAQ